MSDKRAKHAGIRTAAGVAAVAAATVTMTVSVPAAATAATAPQAPTVVTTVDGNNLGITLTDPNRGLSHALTVCTAGLVSIEKAVPLVPDIVAETLPPLSELTGVLEWGPGLPTTSALAREVTYEVSDVPTGFYLTLGVCTGPNVGDAAVAIAPVYVGPTLGMGSAALGLGSTVLATPGMVGIVLGLLGLDTGSLGSVDSGSSDSGSAGSQAGSSFGAGSSSGSSGS